MSINGGTPNSWMIYKGTSEKKKGLIVDHWTTKKNSWFALLCWPSTDLQVNPYRTKKTVPWRKYHDEIVTKSYINWSGKGQRLPTCELQNTKSELQRVLKLKDQRTSKIMDFPWVSYDHDFTMRNFGGWFGFPSSSNIAMKHHRIDFVHVFSHTFL